MLFEYSVSEMYDAAASFSFYNGDCLDFLRTVPDGAVRLVVTSPPYNIGKSYESERMPLEDYVEWQRLVIGECERVLVDGGSICWQAGNHVERGVVTPIDSLLFPVFRSFGLVPRNRVIWHFEHGAHCTRRLSGRYETISWFTKVGEYLFDVDPIRVPQKYPGKRHFKGEKVGQLSGNPLGKNPGDVWVIPNVKHNHVEKTVHPCQFPVELVERLVLSMTRPGELVLDPFMGVASAAAAALRHGRRAAGAELVSEYYRIGLDRAAAAAGGTLRTRPMGRPVYAPGPGSARRRPAEGSGSLPPQQARIDFD